MFARQIVGVIVASILLLWGAIAAAESVSLPVNVTGGVIINHLVKLTGTPSTVETTLTSDVIGAIGIASDNGYGGTSRVITSGLASCLFDDSVNAGDYVTISSLIAGACHDAGPTKPATGTSVGQVTQTGAANTYSVLLQVPNAVTTISPPNNLFCPFGDSVGAQDINSGSPNPLSATVSSTLNLDVSRGVHYWAVLLSRGRVRSPSSTANFSHNGDTAANALARISTAIAAHCGIYHVDLGNNDCNEGVPVATIEANLTTIWNDFLAAGAVVIASPPHQFENSVVSVQLCWAQLEQWVRRQNGTMAGLYIYDPTSIWLQPQDADLTPKTNYAWGNPGVHPTTLGAYELYTPLAAILDLIFPDPGEPLATIQDVYNATEAPSGNLLPGSPFATANNAGTVTGTGLSGVAPTSWVLSDYSLGTPFASMTTVGSMTTGSDGRVWEQIALGGTVATTGDNSTQIYLSYTFGSFTNFSVGDTVIGDCDVQVDTNVSGVSSIALDFLTEESSTYYTTSFGDIAGQTDIFPTPAAMIDGRLETPPHTLTAVPAYFQVAAKIWPLYNGGSAQAVAGNVRFGNCTLRKM